MTTKLLPLAMVLSAMLLLHRADGRNTCAKMRATTVDLMAHAAYPYSAQVLLSGRLPSGERSAQRSACAEAGSEAAIRAQQQTQAGNVPIGICNCRGSCKRMG